MRREFNGLVREGADAELLDRPCGKVQGYCDPAENDEDDGPEQQVEQLLLDQPVVPVHFQGRARLEVYMACFCFMRSPWEAGKS